MDQHHDHAHHQGPPPKEVSHPVLWIAGLLVSAVIIVGWFIYWFGVGAIHGRDAGPLPAQTKAAPEPDHAALITNLGPDVLAKGEVVYANKCASCHGGDGTQTTGGHIRNLSRDPFRSPDGAGPYGLYLTLTNGLGAQMPAYKASLSVEERYAAVHFIREKIIKPKNTAHYADDVDAVKARIPRPGAAGAGAASGPELPPWKVQPPKGMDALLAHQAGAAETRTAALAAWIAAADLSAIDRSILAAAKPGHLDGLAVAIRSGAEVQVASLLSTIMPMRSRSDFAEIHRRLAAAPTGVPQ